MPNLKFEPVPHDHKRFLKRALKRSGFKEAYASLEVEYSIVSQLLAARNQSGLTQEAVATRMGTTKSAISRMESTGKHVPSLATLKKYADVVGCKLEIKLVPLT